MKPINEQINPKFVSQARKLAKLGHLLDEILPAEYRPHVEVASIRQQSLMLITDSPVWTTRLRQLSPQILRFFQQRLSREQLPDGQMLHHVQIMTRYPAGAAGNETPEKKPRHAPVLSEKTASLLKQSADSIDHQPLKSALLKLTRHTHKPGFSSS